MLNDQDITRLKKIFSTKEDFSNLEKGLKSLESRIIGLVAPIISDLRTIKEKQREQDKKFDHIMVIADRIFAPIDELRLENAMSATQYRRQVEWNHKFAKKIDVPFDY